MELSDAALELVAARFRALAEPSRLRLIRQLEQHGESNVTSLLAATGLSQANASRHLQTLTEAGILGRRREGLHVIYFIADPQIPELCALVCGGLERRLRAQSELMSPPRSARPAARKLAPAGKKSGG